MKKVFKFVFVFFLLSCSNLLIETQTRIQVENLTKGIISDFCIVSKNGQKTMILIPGSIEIGKKSKPKEIELVGEFDFGIYVGGKLEPLGTHKLKGGSLLARITEEGGKFEME